MSELIVVANIVAKNDKIDYVKNELLKLIEPTRAEEGCLEYVLHQDNENPAHLMFYEKWTSKECLQAHMQTEHFQNCMKANEDSVESVTINEMTQL